MLPANNLSKYFEELAQNGWVLIEVDLEHSLQLRNSAEKRLRDQQFKAATITDTHKKSGEIRNDSTLWLDQNSSHISEHELHTLKELDRLRAELRDFFRIGLNEIECHYSIYNPGQFYRRHQDITEQKNKRHFSFVIYLNPDWKTNEGGELIGYTGESVLFRVSPDIGRMVLFRSDLEHEVLAPERQRFTLTGWIRT